MAGNDTPNDEAARDVRDAHERRDSIHRIRGQILSDVSGLESGLDVLLMRYFDRPFSADDPFLTWVLSSIDLSRKVELVQMATKELGIWDRAELTIARLKRSVAIRNEIAHSEVTFNPFVQEISAETRREFLRWHSVGRSRKGSKQQLIEQEKLEADARLVSDVQGLVTRLMMGFLASRVGKKPADSIDEFDALNPEIARLAFTPL
jgi:hypothetical protein